MRFVEKMPRKKKIIAKKTQVCVLASPSRLPDADDVKSPMPRTPPRAHSTSFDVNSSRWKRFTCCNSLALSRVRVIVTLK